MLTKVHSLGGNAAYMQSCERYTDIRSHKECVSVCLFSRSCVTLTVRLAHGTADAVMFPSLHSANVLLLGLSGSAHLQLHRRRHTDKNQCMLGD